MTSNPTKVLLTWYGITDYRASLGFERDGDGPVLGALKAEPYALVLVLGYQNSAKTMPPGYEVAEELSRMEDPGDFGAQRKFVDETANTAPAHRHYVSWLKRHLTEAGIETQVQFHPVPLADLNDSDGIYKAATAALDCIAQIPGDFDVSLFLSPGTPVMAFTWALAALRFPRLNRRLISSSRPPRPPEVIRLPDAWTGWNAEQSPAFDPFDAEYDVVFHLYGEQKMPAYWGISQIKAKKHVFVTSPQYSISMFQRCFPGLGFSTLLVSPFDAMDVEVRIRETVASYPKNARIAFNLTGGTKLMYAGALAACRSVDGVPFYFNIENHSIVCLNGFASRPILDLGSILPFIQLNGRDLKITNDGVYENVPGIADEQRRRLVAELWSLRSPVSEHYRKLTEFQPKQWTGRSSVKFKPFAFTDKVNGLPFSAKLDNAGSATVELNGNTYSFAKFETLASFLTGGWFEEYVYEQLVPLREKGLIHDLRINFEVSFSNPEGRGKAGRGPSLDPYQEMDIVFTDGSRLYIVECKAGNVMIDHVTKLQNVTRNYGGVGGRGILASCFPLRAAQKKRLSDARECRCVFGENIAERIEAIILEDRSKYLAVQNPSSQPSN